MLLNNSKLIGYQMIPGKIRYEIENSPLILNIINRNSIQKEWKNFTRTVFDRIARRINQEVTIKVLEAPYLLKDFLLFGQYEYENILFKHRLSDLDGFLEILKLTNSQRPYNWISGKTLQGYWNGGDAKEKKLNVLLTFLGVKLQDWDEWKNTYEETESHPSNDESNNETLRLLRNHFTGYYFRYFQKSDNSNVLIKTPFVILDEAGVITVETKTIGHKYKSSSISIRNGVLYVECENIIWNEKESYIFNIGFESNPQVITGVSNTLNRKGQAMALKNVLVKQIFPFNYSEINGIEIPYSEELHPDSEEAKVLMFFKGNNNLITVPSCNTLDELAHPINGSAKTVFV